MQPPTNNCKPPFASPVFPLLRKESSSCWLLITLRLYSTPTLASSDLHRPGVRPDSVCYLDDTLWALWHQRLGSVLVIMACPTDAGLHRCVAIIAASVMANNLAALQGQGPHERLLQPDGSSALELSSCPVLALCFHQSSTSRILKHIKHTMAP